MTTMAGVMACNGGDGRRQYDACSQRKIAAAMAVDDGGGVGDGGG